MYCVLILRFLGKMELGLLIVLLYSTCGQCISVVSTCALSPDIVFHGLYVDCHGRSLDEIPQDFPTNTTSINLSKNNIGAVPNNSFSSIRKLKYLNLEKNQISRLEGLAFQDCKELNTLMLKENPLCLGTGSHQDSVFDGLRELQYLSVGGNDILCPQNDTGRIFKHLKNLKQIHLFLNKEPNFSGFQGLIKLRYIGIYGNTYLQNNTFRDIMHLEIHTLRLHCTIGILEENVFAHLPHLQTLSMKRTDVGLNKTLASLYGLRGRALTTLEMDYVSDYKGFQLVNDIEELILRQESLKYLLSMCVKRLILPNNNIIYIDVASMAYSVIGSCMEHMDLSRNAITHMQFHTILALRCFSKLTFLDWSEQDTFKVSMRVPHILSDNFTSSTPWCQDEVQRKQVDNMTFKSNIRGVNPILPPVLEILNVSEISWKFGHIDFNVSVYNGRFLTHADFSYIGLSRVRGSIKGLTSITYLDMSGNSDLELVDNFFDYMQTLKHLKLSAQSLPQSNLDLQGKRFLSVLPNLKSFHISGNRLVQLPPNLFASNPLLEYLDLSRNIFTSIPMELLVNPSLLVLDMESNSLGSLGSSTRQQIDLRFEKTNLSFQLKLNGNFFSCSCGNYRFLFWLKETNVFDEKQNALSCITQNGRITDTGKVNANFVKFWRQCTSETLLSVSVVLLTLLMSSVLLTLLIATNKTRFVYYFLNALKFQIPKPKREDYMKDVYVSYADADYQWICHELRPRLEERNLTLYIWDRDSDPGDSIPDQIAHTIPQCWKTILYYSANYVADPWSYMSMMAAINCVDSLNPEKLILLLPEDEYPRIPDCLLEVVPESCVLRVSADVTRIDPIWGEISQLITKKRN